MSFLITNIKKTILMYEIRTTVHKSSLFYSLISYNIVLFQMFQVTIFLVAIVSALCAEIPSPISSESIFTPDVAERIETHPIYQKQVISEENHHPIYRGEEYRNIGRVRVEPVRSLGNIVKHDMLSDEPAPSVATEVNRIVSIKYIP